MARAITQIRQNVLSAEEQQTLATSELLEELAENKEAIIAAIGVIKSLNNLKILDTIQAAVEKSEDIGVIAMQQMNQPTMHNVIKNGISAFKFLGSLQPGQMETLMEAAGHGLKKMSRTGEKGEKQSIWRLRMRIWTPEIRAAMTTMVDFMQGMGEVFLRNNKQSK
ncbi:MAG: hypothetical protein Q8906_02615 [Bacillota bacterium]|nr:hypothetical protein [Bacillota bacterium]MDP4169474.1 hypothetical protein [Bacillota bacterium]